MKEIKESLIQYCLNNRVVPRFVLESPEWQKALWQLLKILKKWAVEHPELAMTIFSAETTVEEDEVVVDLGSPQKNACIDCEPAPIIKIKKVTRKTSLMNMFKEMNNA